MYKKPIKQYKSHIRGFELKNLNFEKSTSLSFVNSENGFNKPIFALEILMKINKNYSNILKKYWGNSVYKMSDWAEKAQELSCDILSLKFNIDEPNEIEQAIKTFEQILPKINKPLIITGSNKKNIDEILLPQLAQIAPNNSIIGIAEQDCYKDLAKIIIKKNHYIIARTPIDINLAKELNILLCETGVSPDKILIDTNMAALGYGLDYGYSIMERVKLAGLDGDEMLNMPIIAFVGEEAWKVKEARVDDYNENYGNFSSRAIAWESATATAIMLAGANILVLWHPDVLLGLKEFSKGV